MKRLSYTLAAFTLGAFLLVGCAKENNKYDKILTEGAWTISTTESEDKTVVFDKNVGSPNETTTSTTKTSLSGGTMVWTSTDVNAVVGSADATELNELTYDMSGSMTFTEAGIYNSESTSTLTHYKHSTNGVVDFDNSVTTDPATTTVADIWAWANTADTKTQITFDGDTYNITVEKGKITLTISRTSEDVQLVSPVQTRTTTITHTETIVATR